MHSSAYIHEKFGYTLSIYLQSYLIHGKIIHGSIGVVQGDGSLLPFNGPKANGKRRGSKQLYSKQLAQIDR